MVYDKNEYLRDRKGYLRRQKKYLQKIKDTPEYKQKNKLQFKKWIENNREHFNELMRKNYQKNKVRQKARMDARKIKIPNGILCQNCHIKPTTEKHHPDYSKPLDVLFVCKGCNEKI